MVEACSLIEIEDYIALQVGVTRGCLRGQAFLFVISLKPSGTPMTLQGGGQHVK